MSEPITPGTARRISLRVRLYLLALACVLPTLSVSGYLLWDNHQLYRRELELRALMTARKVAADLDRELSAVESGLRVLSSSELIQAQDWPHFHARARQALGPLLIHNFVLGEPGGKQIVNTAVSWGKPLPTGGAPASFNRVFSEGETVLTDLFMGPVVKRPVVSMGVPVRLGGEVRYGLVAGIDPASLSQFLQNERLPEDWLLAVLDTGPTIVARSRAAEQFLGQAPVPALLASSRAHAEASFLGQTKEGQPVMTTHVRLPRWGWTVAIGVPLALVEQDATTSLVGWLATGLLALGLGLGLSYRLAGRVLANLQQLNAAARAIGADQPVRVPTVQFQEVDAVSDAIGRAAELLKEVKHRAHHDPLTGLVNRGLFTELLHKQCAQAQRSGEAFALLALDLDHFKQVNDQHGHAAGDAVLVAAAQRLLAGVRAGDSVARVGGDEFLVLMVPADAALATELAGRLVRSLSGAYPAVDVAVGASAGVAVFPRAGGTPEGLLEAADAALYQAKRQGRGGYTLAADVKT